MSIRFDEKTKIFQLNAGECSYVIMLDSGYPVHLYWGDIDFGIVLSGAFVCKTAGAVCISTGLYGCRKMLCHDSGAYAYGNGIVR